MLRAKSSLWGAQGKLDTHVLKEWILLHWLKIYIKVAAIGKYLACSISIEWFQMFNAEVPDMIIK